jgi:hypothetical protein
MEPQAASAPGTLTSRRHGTGAWRRSWLFLPVILAAATSVLAGPMIRPIARIFDPPFPDDAVATALESQFVRDGPIGSRQSQDFAAIGIHTDGFVIFPSLEVSEIYDDNIYATEDDTVSDFATIITPSVSVESLWSRHGLGLRATGRFTEFADHKSENTQQGGLSLTGRADITSQSYLSGFASYSREADERSDPDDQGQREPSLFDRFVGWMLYAHKFNRLELRLNNQLQRIDYTAERNADRDRLEIRVEPRLSYEVSPNIKPYLQFGYVDRNFDVPVNEFGDDPDSQTYTAMAGLQFTLGPTFTGELAGGVLHTEFDDPAFDAITTPAVEALLVWDVTRLTRLTQTVSRREAVTTTTDTSSKLVTAASLRVDHELLRNVWLDGEFSYRNEDFQGSSRVDNRIDAEVGVNYLLNRNAALSLGYHYTTRDSTADGGDFNNNVIQLGINLKM